MVVILLSGLLLSPLLIYSQEKGEIYIENIYLEKYDVFAPQDSSGWVGSLTNAFHSTTRDYLILDLISLEEGEYNTLRKLLESERVLRNTGLFTSVKIELEETETGGYDVYIITHDRFTLEPTVLFGYGGGVKTYGGRIAEYNFLGTGTAISAEALHTTENDLGLSGGMSVMVPDLFGTLVNLNAATYSNKLLTTQNAALVYPYRYLGPDHSWGIFGFRSFGEAFLYSRRDGVFELVQSDVENARAFYSISLERESMVYATASLEMNYADRGPKVFRRALDNTGIFLLSFSSSSKEFTTLEKADYYQVQDLQLGGYGEAIVGKAFPIEEGGANMYYIAARGEQSYYDGKNYLFGQVSGGSGFQQGNPRYTFQSFLGKAFRNFGEDITLAANFRQQTAWNWPAQRQLVLDYQSGLRGYDANEFAGDNRIIGNAELRWMPGYNVWIFGLAAAAFYDTGTAWETGEPLSSTRWKHAAGLGVRIFNGKSAGINSMLRIDFAWNFETRSFGGIIITTGHMFSLFNNHPYRLPDIMGRQFDSF